MAVALGLLMVVAASRIEVAQQRPYDILYVPRPAALRLGSVGHPTLAANLWWLKAVQYMGEPRAAERGWDRLFPALDLITDLDPQHGYVYQVGGNVLASEGRVGESNALLEKGVRNVPDRYIIPFHRAVNAFLYEGDYAAAARWFEVASRRPNAPAHLAEYVSAMYVKGDAPEAAVRFLTHLYERAEDDESRKALRKQLDQAVLERDAALLEDAAHVFEGRHGFPPVALAQLEHDGLVTGIPPDPFGGSYFLDPDGRVRSSVSARRLAPPPTKDEQRALLRRQQLMIHSAEGSVR
ncbi:tetratricopeptide repeat protein [Anaeromyxobacter sp. PSR-1]|uniref:tetratricopeptide repeat protein n=1 Tax=Anaeromyxobacter sp. PSR-1 TaxID=1300915 RepID=UPI001ED9AAEF|nr:tetratricopeptide repeat protein [Anaeromyxobacter sp. PSR-1]